MPLIAFSSITNQGLRESVIFCRTGILLAKGDGSPLGAKGHSAQIHTLTRSQHQLTDTASSGIEARGWGPQAQTAVRIVNSEQCTSI